MEFMRLLRGGKLIDIYRTHSQAQLELLLHVRVKLNPNYNLTLVVNIPMQFKKTMVSSESLKMTWIEADSECD